MASPKMDVPAEPVKPCPVCGWAEAPSINEGATYSYRMTACNACGWGVETRITYGDDYDSIMEKCFADWNDRRTWGERTNG